jgi:hypothetical protein
MRKLLIVFAVASVAAMASANAASATPPERFHFSDSGSEPGFVQCDGFEIDLDTVSKVDVTVFFDEAGEVVKFLVRTRATDTLTNSVTGKTVVNRGVFQELFTRIEGTDKFTHALVGFRFMGTSPGQGLVLQDVGRIEYSPDEEEILFLAGHHFDVPGGPDVEALFCAALT